MAVWSFKFLYFVQWEWLMLSCPGHLPGQHKRPCITPSISFPFLLASSKTDQPTRKRTFSLSLSLSRANSSCRQMDISTRESTFNICSSASFRRPFLIIYVFLLNQMDLETSSWKLNSCSTIYNCFPLPATFCLKLLLKLPNWKLSISSSTHLFFFLI